MIDPVFVDTNVFIYARDAAEPAKRARAREWLTSLWRENLGRTSVQVLSEFYVNVTRKLANPVTPAAAWREVESLLAWGPQPIDAALLSRARKVEQRWRLSWWDAMIVAAAQLQDCALLLTEDLQDRAVFGGVAVRNPFNVGVQELREPYDVNRATAIRHRPRGRPRKRVGATV